ncbi:MAG: efflux RND transporter permease subunit [Candidatus Palauibacterales bacterium]|nr:efflux RND transporter permease subunit [Candidatus Palauibacterales bacterium]MDP2529281.1 efflux RND transporter permease subunit [Candidatus Palauibacterales bacterium]MDP2583312.1 efflux RND transporter permease subunit [Candidatus Palauibacterales bacterium]
MIELSVRRPVATAALYAALLALGAYSFRLIPIELLPEVSYPRLTVTASWPGASPELLESQVTAPLEEAAQQVGGVRKVTSTSRADPRGTGSSAEIDVQFARGTRMEFARLDLGERVAALHDELPAGATTSVEPYVPDEFSQQTRPFLSWQVRGPYTSTRLAEAVRQEVRPRLLSMDGVSFARVSGGRRRILSVELDPDRLAGYGLTPDEVRSRLLALDEARPAGSVVLAGRRLDLSIRSRAASVADLEELVVLPRPQGAVRLRDIGRVRLEEAPATSYHRIDGQPTVSLQVGRQAGSNAIDVADRVKAEVDSLRALLPPGASLELDQDQSQDIKAQLSDLRLRALAAAAVIFLVLMLFLRSLGAVLTVFGTIAFSVLAAVNGLYLGGFSLNVLTLAGLAWGFGLVVDNGIVVLENVERRREAGEGRLEAAIRGARQVVLPVVASTATTAIVLVPFLFLQGELRLYYVPLAFAVGFSILASLFVAFTFVPAMAARLGGWREGRGSAARDVAPGTAMAGPTGAAGADAAGGTSAAEGAPRPAGRRPPPFYVRGYRALLSGALDHPLLVVLVCAGALWGSWRLFDAHVTRGITWSSYFGQQTYISIQITFPRGAGLERTDALTRSFEARLATLPEVKRYEATVLPQYAFIKVTFPKALERTQVPVAIKQRMVAYSYGFSGVDVRVYGYGPSFYGGGGSPPNYSVNLYGYNYLALRDYADQLAARLKHFSRIRNVDPNSSGAWYEQDRAFEYALAPRRAALAGYGLSVKDLLDYVSADVSGSAPGGALGGQVHVGDREYPLEVKLAGYQDLDVRGLEGLRVRGAGGRHADVGDVATVRRREVLARIVREDQQYRRTVAWEFRGPRKLGDVERDAVLDAMHLPPGYRIEKQEPYRLSSEQKGEVYLALGFAVLLIYMTTAALFESLAAPFVVLLTLPLALIGVFLVFFYTDASFTRTAYIGTIMMTGIVVNNAILVVYHIGELREREGLGPREAILRGTLERVRPILMTTATTVLGLLPLVLFAGSQDSNIWNALALATIGGLLSSTLFVLVAIPVAYQWIVARRHIIS